jgi:hypothetical protein
MKTVAILLLAVFLPFQIFARLGETEDQIIKRYGKPIMRPPECKIFDGKVIKLGERLYFTQESWNISCVMIDKVCVAIIYSKTGDLTTEQRQHILRTNSTGDQHWVDGKKSNSMVTVWLRSDGARAERAAYSSSTISLFVADYDKKVKAIEDGIKKQSDKLPSI